MINKKAKELILELCGIVLDENLSDAIDVDKVNDDYIIEILECALEHLDGSIILSQEDWEKDLSKTTVH